MMYDNDSQPGSAPLPGAEGDFERLAAFATPTEAYLLRGALQAAGLSPVVADANLAQANPWLANAMGGVRVLLPASQLAAGRQVMAQWHAGELQLDGDDATPVPRALSQLSEPIFSPDASVLWSFLLTPVFGGVIHVLNARRLGDARLQRTAGLSLVVLLLVTAFGARVAHRLVADEYVLFRASIIVSFVTLVWYFTAGVRQSKHVLEAYGRRYSRKSLLLPALAAAAGLLATGWGLDTLA